MIDGPESISLELGIVDLILVILVENEVKDAFGLNLGPLVGSPNLEGSYLVDVFIGLKLRHNDQLFEGNIEMFLIVVER